MPNRKLQFRLWNLFALALAVSLVLAVFRPVAVRVDFELDSVVCDPYFQGRQTAQVRMTNTSATSVYWRTEEYQTGQYCRGQWRGCGFTGGGTISDDSPIVYLMSIPPGESELVAVPLLPECEALKVCVQLSTSKHFRWSWYWSSELKLKE